MNLIRRKCIWQEKKCPLGNSKKNKFTTKQNFYENYISNYFQTNLKKINSKNCSKCKISINNNWFNLSDSYNIFNSVYGQHHRGWKNFYDFEKGNNKKKDHSEKIIKKINKYIKIKNYSEFNCPFQGNFFSFLSKELDFKTIKKLTFLLKKRIKLTQLANKDPNTFNKKFKEFSKLNLKIKKLKKKIKKKITKYLILDHSSSCWSDGCISEGINCKSIAQELFGIKILNLDEVKDQKFNFDLFCFFNTFDHTSNPKKILDFALKNSKLVLILNHADPIVTKQHLFSIQKTFFKFLKEKKVYSLDVSNQIDSEIKKNIMFLCTKNKKILKLIKNI